MGILKVTALLSCLAGMAVDLFAFSAPDRTELLSALQLRYQTPRGKYASKQNPINGLVFQIQQQGLAVTNVSSGTVMPENKVVDGRLLRLGVFSQMRLQQGGGRLLAKAKLFG